MGLPGALFLIPVNDFFLFYEKSVNVGIIYYEVKKREVW